MLIAIGGNALIRDGQRGTIAEQFDNSRAIARQVAALVAAGWRVVVTHGNGPQVGFILLRSELATDDVTIPRLSLDMAVADSQGGLGYIVGNTLVSELGRLGLRDRVACLLTQTVVDADDPAFATPSKPIGAFFSADEARVHRTRDRWVMVEDAGRGYRRVVAVVDKDLASAQLGTALGASVLLLSTGVEKVATGFGTPQRRDLDRVAVTEMRRHLAAGEFPSGSMGPKIEAAIAFLERGRREVIVTSAHRLADAVTGDTGTHITAG